MVQSVWATAVTSSRITVGWSTCHHHHHYHYCHDHYHNDNNHQPGQEVGAVAEAEAVQGEAVADGGEDGEAEQRGAVHHVVQTVPEVELETKAIRRFVIISLLALSHLRYY